MRTRIRGTMSKPRVGPIFSGTRFSAHGTPSAFASAVAPSGAVAAKAVAVNPEKSDRAIAADFGVGNPPRPAASAAVASVRPANDGADDSSRAAVTPPCARPPPATPPPSNSVVDPNAPVLRRASGQNLIFSGFGVVVTLATVSRARKKATVANAAVAKRSGKDGKARRVPKRAGHRNGGIDPIHQRAISGPAGKEEKRSA